MLVNTNLHIPGTNVKLGDRARDRITGFEGIVTTHVRYLTGCDAVWLRASANEDGKAREQWAHVPVLELVDDNPLEVKSMPKDVPASG